MTEHSTAELKRQYEAAKDSARQADEARIKARKEWSSSACADLLEKFEKMGGVIGKTRVRRVFHGEPMLGHGPYVVMGARAVQGHDRVVFILSSIETYREPKITTDNAIAILPEDQE